MKVIRNILIITLFVFVLIADFFANNALDTGMINFISNTIRPSFIGQFSDCPDIYDCKSADKFAAILLLFLVGLLAYIVVDAERRLIWTILAAAELLSVFWWFVLAGDSSAFGISDEFPFLSASLLALLAMMGSVLSGGLIAAVIRIRVFRQRRSFEADSKSLR